MWSIDNLQEVWRLASSLHNGQKYGSQKEEEEVEYLYHIGSVTFEILNPSNQAADMQADLVTNCGNFMTLIKLMVKMFDDE